MADDTKADKAEPLTWPYHFPLAKPKEVFGDMIAALDLREPTGAEFVKFGLFDDTVSGDQMLDLIAVLSGKTPLTIRALPGTDMLRLSRKLMQVFTEAAQ